MRAAGGRIELNVEGYPRNRCFLLKAIVEPERRFHGSWAFGYSLNLDVNK